MRAYISCNLSCWEISIGIWTSKAFSELSISSDNSLSRIGTGDELASFNVIDKARTLLKTLKKILGFLVETCCFNYDSLITQSISRIGIVPIYFELINDHLGFSFICLLCIHSKLLLLLLQYVRRHFFAAINVFHQVFAHNAWALAILWVRVRQRSCSKRLWISSFNLTYSWPKGPIIRLVDLSRHEALCFHLIIYA